MSRTSPDPVPLLVSNRPFKLIDLLVLLVNLGCAFTLVRLMWNQRGLPGIPAALKHWEYLLSRYTGDPDRWFTAITFYLDPLISSAAALWLVPTLTLAVAWIIPPRPARERLWTLPGAVATLAATFGVVLDLALLLALFGNPTAPDGVGIPPGQLPKLLMASIGPIGLCVLGSWLRLHWSVRWRAEPTWRDRLGRLVGAGWLLLLLIGPVLIAGTLFLQHSMSRRTW